MPKSFLLNDHPEPVAHTHAHYEGKCPGCGDRIYEGDDIYLHDGDWLCAPCHVEYEES